MAQSEVLSASRSRLRAPGDAAILFLAIGIVFATIWLAMVPAGWGLDEQSHAYRAFQVSSGTLRPLERSDGVTYGGPVPEALYDYLQLGWSDSNAVDRGQHFWERSDLKYPERYRTLGSATVVVSDGDPDVDFSNAAVSSPVPYLPAATGMYLARLLDGDAHAVVLGARIAGAVSYLALAFLALVVLRGRRNRWVVFSVALLPMALFQSVVISADALTNGACLVLLALLLRGASHRDPPAPRSFVSMLAAAAFLVAMSKPTYVALVVPALLLPAAALGPSRRGLPGRVIVASAGALGVLLSMLSTAGTTASLDQQRPDLAEQIDAGRQLGAMLGAPLEAGAMLVRTAVYFGDTWPGGAVGLFGYSTVELPALLVTAAVLTIAASAAYGERMARHQAAVLLASALATCLGIVVALYLTFNAVGAQMADGVQGRYFIPVVIPLFVGAAGVLRMRVVLDPSRARWIFPLAAATWLTASVVVFRLTVY